MTDTPTTRLERWRELAKQAGLDGEHEDVAFNEVCGNPRIITLAKVNNAEAPADSNTPLILTWPDNHVEFECPDGSIDVIHIGSGRPTHRNRELYASGKRTLNP